MASNQQRRDPYKNFNFRVAIGAALVGLAAFMVTKKISKAKGQGGAARRNAYWRLFGMDLGGN